MYKALVIRTEPRGKAYQQLIEFAVKNCTSFSLIWTEGGPLNIKRAAIDLELKHALKHEECIREWCDFYTFLSFYHLTPESSAVLIKATSLYQWHDPGWPRDLAFYADGDKQWLFSSTQNHEAHIYTNPIPLETLRAELSDIDIAFEKPTITIDGQNIHTLEEFYEEISNKVIPGATWGCNLDAFNDVLWGGFGTSPDGFVLLWQNSHIARQRLGYEETVRQLEIRRRRCHPGNIPHVDQDLKRAKQGEGYTVFDWLVEIIEGHEIIDLVLG